MTVCVPAIDTLARVTQDQINAPRRVLTASGLALGADHVDVLVDGVWQGRAVHPGWADPVGAWSFNLNPAAGSHTLTVNAVHPSHQYTATASSTFTVVAQSLGGNVTSAYDADGDVTSRTWDSGLAQTLTWDAFGRLIKVAQRDSASNGYDWSAIYDGLGRRLKITQQAVTANVASGVATVTTSIYDPQVEFLEIGVAVNGAKAWKVYGPDLNGRFGGLQGTGGLEATIVQSSGANKGVINDQFGNGVASVTGGTVSWFTTRVGAYGPLPGSQTETLTDITRVAEATAWRSRRIDPTGFYNLGARYYEPSSGRFLSADPMGHAASPSLYDYASGDPVNYFDPDGRLGKDSNNALWSRDKCAALVKQIAAEESLVRKQLATRKDILNEAPGARDYLNKPLDYADVSNNLSDLAKAFSTKYSDILETTRFGTGVKVTGNVVAVAGIVANSVQMGNSAVDYLHGRLGAGGQFWGSAAGYTLGVGLLAANLNGVGAVAVYNPVAAAGGLGIIVSLGIYDSHLKAVNAEEAAQTADQLAGYIQRDLAAAAQNQSDFNAHCK